MAGVMVVSADLIEEILAKLPVKSLLRFNCVCKTWYSIISDPQFCNTFHQMRPCLLISDDFSKLSTITVESLLTKKDRTPTPHSLPWETEPDNDYIILGSCNGLVLVNHRCFREGKLESSELILWNPSTKKFKRLPWPQSDSILFGWGSCTCAGFGYDELIHDYKLVLVTCTPAIAELHVFTLKSNTWRRSLVVDDTALHCIRCFFNSPGRGSISIGVFSNGAIHWLQQNEFHTHGDSLEKCILALDLGTEEFRLFKFCHAPLGLIGWLGSLLGGCLCVSGYGDEDGCPVISLWMMKEYGVESSWTKLVSIPIPGIHFLKFYPILFWKESKEEMVVNLTIVTLILVGARLSSSELKEGKISSLKKICCLLSEIPVNIKLPITWRVWSLLFEQNDDNTE